MSTLLAEELRAIIEGPLGMDIVSEETVNERVGMVAQNERRHVFGALVYRDGDDTYYTNDEQTPLTRRQVVETVSSLLESRGRLLREKLGMGALMAMGDQQKEVDAAEAKIGGTFKKLAKRYVKALEDMTGAKWKVVSANESIFSLDSNENPKRAIDIYWEYDPGSQTATVYVEGPKGAQKAYSQQKVKDIAGKNYISWLVNMLKEEMDSILELALHEDEELPTEDASHEEDDAQGNPRESLIEEVVSIIGKAVPSGGSSATRVGQLFEQLVAAVRRGGDLDPTSDDLRDEGVPEKHISYAIQFQEVPYIYQ